MAPVIGVRSSAYGFILWLMVRLFRFRVYIICYLSRVDVVADIKNMIDDVKKVTITEMDSRTESSFTSM